MTLWAWVAEFPAQPAAIPATAATKQGDKGALSQVSQLSQRVSDEPRGQGSPELLQLSQQSQPLGSSPACPEDDADDAHEAFEERAAIMEYDGGMTRAEAERAAASNILQVDTSPAEAVRWPFEEWGDLRPCLLCRNLSPGGRCLAAWRGELRAARDYSPTFPGQPQRCIGYRPKVDDPDRTPGRERWPELVAWQARLNNDGKPEGRAHG